MSLNELRQVLTLCSCPVSACDRAVAARRIQESNGNCPHYIRQSHICLQTLDQFPFCAFPVIRHSGSNILALCGARFFSSVDLCSFCFLFFFQRTVKKKNLHPLLSLASPCPTISDWLPVLLVKVTRSDHCRCGANVNTGLFAM